MRRCKHKGLNADACCNEAMVPIASSLQLSIQLLSALRWVLSVETCSDRPAAARALQHLRWLTMSGLNFGCAVCMVRCCRVDGSTAQDKGQSKAVLCAVTCES